METTVLRYSIQYSLTAKCKLAAFAGWWPKRDPSEVFTSHSVVHPMRNHTQLKPVCLKAQSKDHAVNDTLVFYPQIFNYRIMEVFKGRGWALLVTRPLPQRRRNENIKIDEISSINSSDCGVVHAECRSDWWILKAAGRYSCTELSMHNTRWRRVMGGLHNLAYTLYRIRAFAFGICATPADDECWFGRPIKVKSARACIKLDYKRWGGCCWSWWSATTTIQQLAG